ncbi:hypothetical protein JM946_09690 [Steroidobacter sp. S1-65]|uniref:Uncharacterized protein n=1 Tax=Steroidobacter gossypii TaxID=2805490 RepID=A0ABS1WVM6_9GAMM|nr:hypothetical protein [Steroidobacter gossypii]MBM0105022.1 hypothetical protein [Steroidobacter gossypii]
MLNLSIVGLTFIYATIVANARFDWLSTYYLIGAVFVVGVGVILGTLPQVRIRSFRLHLWIIGICACFLLMWWAAGTDSFSGQQVNDLSLVEAVSKFAPRMLLLYLGLLLSSQAAPAIKDFFHRFLATPTTAFTDTLIKVRAAFYIVLLVVGMCALLTGGLPTLHFIFENVAGLFGTVK